MKRLFLLTLSLMAITCIEAATLNLPEHPRLLVTNADIPTLKERLSHPDMASTRKVHLQQKSYVTDGIIKGDTPDERIRQKMEALAFEYLLDNSKKKSAQEAIDIATNYLTSIYNARNGERYKEYWDITYAYEAIFGAAMVYDWCYNAMTPQQKNSLGEAMRNACQLTEYGIPPVKVQQYLSGHYGEMAPTIYLAIGTAIYDEDKFFLDYAYEQQVNGFAPSRNFMFQAGTHHQGAQYIHVRHTSELLQHLILKKLGMSPYTDDINTLTIRALYNTLPQKKDMDGMTEGDAHNHLEMGYSQLYYISAALSRKPHLQYMAKKYLPATENQSTRLFIYYDPTIKATEPENSLCLSKYFPTPAGTMIARTAWDINSASFDSPVMAVLMQMKEYNAQNHTHLDAGHFGIYYKGHLALDAGIYQGKDDGNGWGKINFGNYYSRTIAHNTLTILDPNEPAPMVAWKFKGVSRDGGQFFFNERAWDNTQDMVAKGKSSQVLAHEISEGQAPEYSYLKGDMTKAYNVPSFIAEYPAKAECVKRSFVFLNLKDEQVPGALIVLDRVVSSYADFKKRWLLHTQNQPVVSANTIVAENRNEGRSGRLHNTILLPEVDNTEVVLVGGAGKEYLVDGTNWGTVTQEDAGQWRAELSPRKASKEDNFLNVLQATDAKKGKTLPVTHTTSKDGRYVAVEIGNRVVAQQLELGLNSTPVEIKVGQSDKTYKILVTDLAAGKWKASCGATTKTVEVGESGTLYIDAKGGRLKLVKI